MTSIVWHFPEKLFRGCVIDADTSAHIDSIVPEFRECWNQVAILIKSLSSQEASQEITLEIWPDTGRFIWILRDKREYCRLVLTSQSIERAYFDLISSQDFEHQYNILITRLLKLAQISFDNLSVSDSSIVLVRDSDSIESTVRCKN